MSTKFSPSEGHSDMLSNPRANRTIWVIRHGQRIDNVDPTWKNNAPRGAWDDPTLSKRGIVQAQECGVRLSTEQIDVIYCSPFIRCVQTAEQILQKYPKRLKIFIEPGICETLCSTQYPPGYLSMKELGEKYSMIDANYVQIVPKPERERNNLNCRGRLKKVIDNALQRSTGVILLVTHGSPVAMIHEILTGSWNYVGQCTISKFVSDENGNFVATLKGDSSHLSDRTDLRDHENTRALDSREIG